MKKKIQLVLFLAGSALIIALGIRAGEHHENCRECPLGQHVPEVPEVPGVPGVPEVKF